MKKILSLVCLLMLTMTSTWAEEGDVLVAPAGWTNAITNGNLAGDNVASFVSKEYPSSDVVGAAIVAGAGKDGSRGIVVKTADETGVEGAADWDSQFWIVLNDELPTGTMLHVEFDFKASQTATASTQAHANPGDYHHWAAIGDVNFTTEWQHFSADIVVSDAMAKGNDGNGTGTGLKSIAFNLAVNRNAVDYYFDNFGVWYQAPKEPVWTDITNGDGRCFLSKEYPSTEILPAKFENDEYVVNSAAQVEGGNVWDSQFWIRMPQTLEAGKKFKIAFDYKASAAVTVGTQSHAEPGSYIDWHCLGDLGFTGDWQTYDKVATVPVECEGKNFQSIAFNLTQENQDVVYYFKNIKIEVDEDDVTLSDLDFYLAGSFNEWAPTADYKLVLNEAAEVEEYMITLDLKAGDKFKVIKGSNWYPAEGDDYTVSKDGKYTIYFRPGYNGDDAWYAGCLYVTFVPEPTIPDGTYYVMNATYGLLVSADGVDKVGTPITFTWDVTAGKYNITGAQFFEGNQWTVDGDGFYTISTVIDNMDKYAYVDFSGYLTIIQDNTVAEGLDWTLLQTEFWENEVLSFNVAGTADLCGTEWDVNANKMTRNEAGLFEWKAENITVSNSIKPEFKVVANNTYDEETVAWYPGGDNWIINTDITGGAGIFTITITFDVATKRIDVAAEKTADLPVVVEATDIAIKPEAGTDIAAELAKAKKGIEKVGNILIELTENAEYTIGATLTAPNNLTIWGNDAIVTVAEENAEPFITLDGTEAAAIKADGSESDHKFIASVVVAGVKVVGLKNAFIKDNQKTYVENVEVNWDNIEMPAGKVVFDFNGKGYIGNLNVTNSTIWGKEGTGFFVQYGSRPKNINGDLYQTFNIYSNTLVNIANGKNMCDMKQNGTDHNVYYISNNIFVDCGKQNQVVVGFNKGQTSSTPLWKVEGNYFEWGGACVNAAETEKAGKHNVGEGEDVESVDIVQDCIDGKLTFTDAANGDFNGEFELAADAQAPWGLGAPVWQIEFKAAPVVVDPGFYLVGTMNDWTPSADYVLVANESTEGEYMITLDLEAGAKFKAIAVDAEGNWAWYPSGDDCSVNNAGNYTIYFRPAGNAEWGWYNLYAAYNGEPVGINAVTTTTDNAVIFNMKGQRVMNARKGLFIINGKKVVK